MYGRKPMTLICLFRKVLYPIRQSHSLACNACYIVSLAILLCSTETAYADSPIFPYSYTEEVPGGEFIFVMLAPETFDEDGDQWNEQARARIREIRRMYSQSGLYRNDGTNKPLWTVDWYALSVEVASDGVHLIRHGPWATSTRDRAIGFYADGELLHEYRIPELVDNPLLLFYTVSHFCWKADRQFEESHLEYSIGTLDGNRFVFDVRTGKIASESRPGRAILWSISPMCISALSIAMFAI